MRPAHRCARRLALITLLGAAFLCAVAAAQQMVVGGRALDNNLQAGSAGINPGRSTASGFTRPNYSARSTAPRRELTGVQRAYYWSPTSSATGAAGASVGFSSAPPRPTVYGGSGLVVGTLENPLDNPLNRMTLVQRGSGGGSSGYLPVTTMQGVSQRGYRAVR
jgi:hypothetical protein